MNNPDKVKDRPRLKLRRPTWRTVWRQVQLLLVMLVAATVFSVSTW